MQVGSVGGKGWLSSVRSGVRVLGRVRSRAWHEVQV